MSEPPTVANVFFLLMLDDWSSLGVSTSMADAEMRITMPVTIATAPTLATLFSVKRLRLNIVFVLHVAIQKKMEKARLNRRDFFIAFFHHKVSLTHALATIMEVLSSTSDNHCDNSTDDQEFAGHVDVFFKLDDELKGVSEEIKDLKSSRSSIEGRIARHMQENGIPETISSSGKIKVYKSKSSAPMNKALIESAASELFGADQAARLMKHIEGKRGVVEKVKIKRVSGSSNTLKKKSRIDIY